MTRLNPITIPRHQLRAEKARRNKGETGSATDGVDGSRFRHRDVPCWVL
jgi:hypothetical protein